MDGPGPGPLIQLGSFRTEVLDSHISGKPVVRAVRTPSCLESTRIRYVCTTPHSTFSPPTSFHQVSILRKAASLLYMSHQVVFEPTFSCQFADFVDHFSRYISISITQVLNDVISAKRPCGGHKLSCASVRY